MAYKFFEYFWNEIDNAATFFYQHCPYCQRFFDENLRKEVNAQCICQTWFMKRCLEEYNKGHLYDYELEKWTPDSCGVKLDK